MKDVKETYPICKKDGFPMVKINGHWECVVEYLDRCIGQQQVVDIIQHGKTVYYVFENGHELPMLCFCCGKPLKYGNLEKARRDLIGRRLERMSIGPVILRDGGKAMQFALEFSKRRWFFRRFYVPIAIKAAARLRHPGYCLYKGTSLKKATDKKEL